MIWVSNTKSLCTREDQHKKKSLNMGGLRFKETEKGNEDANLCTRVSTFHWVVGPTHLWAAGCSRVDDDRKERRPPRSPRRHHRSGKKWRNAALSARFHPRIPPLLPARFHPRIKMTPAGVGPDQLLRAKHSTFYRTAMKRSHVPSQVLLPRKHSH